jgi:hypothetical protein
VTDREAAQALQSELTAVRLELSTTAWGVAAGGGPTLSSWLGAVVLGALAVGSVGLGLLALGTGDPGVAGFFLLVGVFVAVPAALVVRRLARQLRPVSADRRRLLLREQELVALSAGLPSASPPVGDWLDAPTDLPLPADRQPTPYAQLMWTRFRIGPSPEAALRRLPSDAPAWKVTFHRTVGWGLTGAVVVAAALLTIYITFSTHR